MTKSTNIASKTKNGKAHGGKKDKQSGKRPSNGKFKGKPPKKSQESFSRQKANANGNTKPPNGEKSKSNHTSKTSTIKKNGASDTNHSKKVSFDTSTAKKPSSKTPAKQNKTSSSKEEVFISGA